MAPNDDRLAYNADETVLCYHGPLMYEAKVLKAEFWEKGSKTDPEDNGPHYYVHYKGWNAKWDQWVPESRMLKWTPENLRKQAELEETISPTGRRSSVRMSGERRGPGRPPLSASAGPGDATGETTYRGPGRKRRRDSTMKSSQDSDTPPSIPGFSITIPPALKEHLKRDYDQVVNQNILIPLPRTHTINQILHQYMFARLKLSNPITQPDTLKTLTAGLKLYFTSAIKNLLLYRVERKQYEKFAGGKSGMSDGEKERDVCDVYGGEHLLRLFVKLPALVSRVGADQEMVNAFQTYFDDVLRFLEKHRDEYLLSDYNASEDKAES